MDRYLVRSKEHSQSVISNEKKRCNEDSAEINSTPKCQKFCDKEYDKNKRVRRFQTAWWITCPWVDHIPDADDSKPGVMFCATCRAFPQIADQPQHCSSDVPI